MGATSVYALPWPDPPDPSDGPAAFQDLATDTEAALLANAKGAPLAVVTALPGSPTDGQVVLYQDATLAAQGIVWQLRYRAASASAYKWEFIGGSPFIKKFPGSVTQAGGAFVVRPDLAGATILAAPLAGEYDTWAKAGSVSSDFGTQWLALLVCGGNAAPGSDADAASVGANNHSVPSTSYGAAYAGPNRITVAAAEVIRMYYRNVNGTATYVDRMGAVLPVRVG